MGSRIRFLFLLSLIIPVTYSNLLQAQDINENNFSRYTTTDGLSQDNITGIIQDSTGYIWIATSAGLNRFNGSRFLQFHSTDDSLSLPEDNISAITWLDKNRFTTYPGGLHIINTSTNETSNVFVPYVNKLYQYKFNTIMSVQGSDKGDIFALTRSGFYHFDKNYRLVFRFDYYSAEKVPTSSFRFGRDIFWLDQQRLLVNTADGIFLYLIDKKEFRKMLPADCPALKQFLEYPQSEYQFFQPKPGFLLISSAHEDSLIYINIVSNKKTISLLPQNTFKDEFDYRSELVYISDTLLYVTSNISGFYKMRIDALSGQVTLYPKKYFPNYRCRCLMQDRNHNLWIGTTKGLFRQDNRLSLVQQIPIPSSLEASFPRITMDDIYGTSDKLFVATLGNAGMLEFNKKDYSFIRRTSFTEYRNDADNITSVMAADDRTLFVGINGPLCKVDPVTNKMTKVSLENWEDGDWIADMYKDRDKNIWFACENVYRYETNTRKFSFIPLTDSICHQIQRPNNIQQDADGNIWLSGHGLLRYNLASHRFDKLIDSFPFIKIPDRQVNTFVADQQNNLWFNSNNNGLICYNIDNGTFRHFTRDNGLPDNNIASLVVLGNKLWIAAFAGIACLDLTTFRITNFGKEDGFPDQPIPKGASFYHDEISNKLYIGFNNTIVAFDPAIIYQKNQPPSLFIDNLTTCDLKNYVFPQKTITTSWRNNDINVTIGSINFVTGNNQRFAYRVVNTDNNSWHELGETNTFSVSNLPAGHHRIQVKVYSTNNRWPEQVRELSIDVLPPFWKQSWFIAIWILLLIILIYLLLSWRTGIIRKKERAKTRIEQLKADEYKNQFELEQISNYFSSSLADKKNVEEVLWDVSKNLIGRMNFTDCMIYMWDDEKTRMIQKASHGPKGTPKAIRSKVFDVLPGQGVVGHVMETKEPVLIKDTRKDGRYRVDDIVRLSELCVPIIHNDELIGIIDSEHPDENHFQERDIKILTTIATLVANKIKQIESEQSLEIKQKEIALINQQLAETQLLALQTQMNPHFIFNSLNSIKGMILADEQQKASRYLSRFAQMIRITLSQSKEIFTTVYENVEHLENYLVMEKLRFDDSFTYIITVDERIDKEEILIPTLMIQPLAENAIWHGLMQKKGEKKLSIRFAKLADTISCTIEDNGIGIKRSEQLKQFNKSPHQSVGLANLRNRIKIMNEKYSTDCTLEITDLQDFNKDKTGTCVILRLNIINYKPNT